MSESSNRFTAPQAAYIPLSHWETLAVQGNDRVDFLKGLLTNSIRKLSVGDGNLTLYLTVKGRIEGEALVHRREQEFLLLSPPGMGQKLHSFLDRYHIMEDLTLLPTDEFQAILCTGTHTGFALPDLGKGAQLFPELETSTWCTRYPLLSPLETFVVWTPTDSVSAVCALLESKQFSRLSEEDFSLLRATHQWFDLEQDLQGQLVHEARLENTHVDFAKGCFVGQEVVARTQHRGQASKHIYTLQALESLPRGASIQDGAGKDMGQVTSSWTLKEDVHLLRALLKHKLLGEAEQLQAVANDRCVPVQLFECPTPPPPEPSE